MCHARSYCTHTVLYYISFLFDRLLAATPYCPSLSHLRRPENVLKKTHSFPFQRTPLWCGTRTARWRLAVAACRGDLASPDDPWGADVPSPPLHSRDVLSCSLDRGLPQLVLYISRQIRLQAPYEKHRVFDCLCQLKLDLQAKGVKHYKDSLRGGRHRRQPLLDNFHLGSLACAVMGVVHLLSWRRPS